MTNRPAGGPAAHPGGLKPAQNFDTNSRMGKVSTAGNVPAKPKAPNTQAQPDMGVNTLQAAMFKRNKTSGGGKGTQ